MAKGKVPSEGSVTLYSLTNLDTTNGGRCLPNKTFGVVLYLRVDSEFPYPVSWIDTLITRKLQCTSPTLFAPPYTANLYKAIVEHVVGRKVTERKMASQSSICHSRW